MGSEAPTCRVSFITTLKNGMEWRMDGLRQSDTQPPENVELNWIFSVGAAALLSFLDRATGYGLLLLLALIRQASLTPRHTMG